MSGSGLQSGSATERTSLLQPARSLSRNSSGGTPNHGAAAQTSSNGSPHYLTDQRPSSAVFQGLLVTALRKEITGLEAEGLIKAIREDSTVLKTLPPELEKAARNAFAMAVKGAFGVSVIPVLSLEEKETPAVAEPTHA
ncbi:BQ5605_C003g02356 [Microbotryum silenes-dioicae]|uniref:BQ5605_C003g02356 protein n=1 Tax=Microbotryum silenes-dioicae TaxID=796604 RepID=A0A2X0NYN1_9BASI|nr:BQ5605_C003g02356 [Microbotryum silenes-dioicae]